MHAGIKAAALVWALSMAALGLPARMALAAPPALDFFKPEQISGVKLSPNGHFLAAVRPVGQRGRKALVVMTLEGERALKVVAVYQDADVETFHWVGNDELVFTLGDERASFFHQEGQGLFAVDREGRYAPRMLIKRSWDDGRMEQGQSTEQRTKPREALDPNHRFFAVPRDGSAKVLVVRLSRDAQGELQGTDLLSVSLATARAEVISRDAPGKVEAWVVDQAGRPRVASVMAGAKSQIHWKREPDGPWTLLHEVPRYVDEGGFRPLELAADGTLFGLARAPSADTSELSTLKVQDGAAPTPRSLVALKGFDFKGQLVMAPGDKVVGVHVLSDAWGSHWFDERLRELQQAVDKALPNTVNRLDCGACDAPKRLVVQAYSDRQPGSYYLYEVEKRQLSLLAHQRPWIPPANTAPRSFERIKARDGLELPLHVTRPEGGKTPRPTVVLVHGGPFVRGGEWRWEATSQFLASRGYLVLEPEFRGSAGYGARLSSAGFRQWGQAMQDDLVDSVDWAVKQGLADGQRVCVVGGSYGGYAALMALVRHGDRFRCAAEFMGVTDIDLLYSHSWSDLSGDWKRHAMPELIGDRKADAAMLAAHSPLQQAARITRPVLMAHGRQDRRVPIEHGTQMHEALKKHNPNVEWVVYEEEGHGWSLDRNEADFWTRVEAFLAKHLAAQ